jgi:hypothetical protein
MARAAVLCAVAGYDEVNINVGCPSPIVAHNQVLHGVESCLRVRASCRTR